MTSPIDFLTHDNNYIWAITAAVSGIALLVMTLRQKSGGALLSPAQATLKINREDAVVIDVRDDGEWSKGRISGARHIPSGQVGERLGELDKYKQRPVIVVCASGHRSASASATLRKAGFEQVFSLDGGIGAWEQAGLPLTRK
ncbi:rhodanese-like domain-containing protein [Methyloversatilis thermotolerans]|uniref:rhodanese-like domain-containing protein n=1 Tax=Methyloversatilis thermotolerans TaxID=1346290 RepID=UPI00036B11A4|nr:rhodanese-like domain-containing protein [Methyloversatilis thermotolerans]